MTVAELIAVLQGYPGDLTVKLFTFNVPNLADGWWHDHPVNGDDDGVEWVGDSLRIVAQD